MKQCFKCHNKKPFSEFYKHPQMADGHLGKCKTCTKKDVIGNRADKIDQYREYDRNRGARQSPEYQRKYRAEYPNKSRAHQMVNYAVRAGNLCPQPCEECHRTESVHAHHDDYSKPLNIRWLCPACHKQWHLKHGEAPNGKRTTKK